MMSDEFRNNLIVTRVRSPRDDDIAKEAMAILVKLFDEQCTAIGLETSFMMGTPAEMMDRSQFDDYSLFMLVSSAAQTLDKRYSPGNGVSMVAVPFRLLDATYIVVMFAPRVIPPNVLDNYLNCGLILCSNEAIVDRARAGAYARTLGVTTLEEAERFVEQTS